MSGQMILSYMVRPPSSQLKSCGRQTDDIIPKMVHWTSKNDFCSDWLHSVKFLPLGLFTHRNAIRKYSVTQYHECSIGVITFCELNRNIFPSSIKVSVSSDDKHDESGLLWTKCSASLDNIISHHVMIVTYSKLALAISWQRAYQDFVHFFDHSWGCCISVLLSADQNMFLKLCNLDRPREIYWTSYVVLYANMCVCVCACAFSCSF